jgi:hypothetical protein
MNWPGQDFDDAPIQPQRCSCLSTKEKEHRVHIARIHALYGKCANHVGAHLHSNWSAPLAAGKRTTWKPQKKEIVADGIFDTTRVLFDNVLSKLQTILHTGTEKENLSTNQNSRNRF